MAGRPSCGRGHRLIACTAARHLAAVALAVFPNTAMTAGYLPGPGWVAPASPSQFTTAYRQRFGHLPSHTLRS